jgi:hypothetical protein
MPADAKPGPDRIAVRMYRGLLGDCFLFTHRHGEETYRALIDCGVLQCIGANKPETKRGPVHIGDVVRELYRNTDGGKLDLVIATHEHYDHLSGFIIENEEFNKFRIGKVWMAWTEDPQDELATDIREKRSKGLEALASVVDANPPAAVALALQSEPSAAEERLQAIAQLLQFYGEIEPPAPVEMGFGAAAKKAEPRVPKDPPRSCSDVFDWLRKKAGAANVRYLYPGQQVRFGVADRLTANVLGPPRTRKRLLQMDPSIKGPREVYLTSRDEVSSVRATLAVYDPESSKQLYASTFPFADRFRRRLPQDSADPIARLYYSRSETDRRIDGEWLGTAESLALKIDGDVNNTSVALAIEGPAGDVLLFPADAQVGNWLSWHDQDYPDPAVPGSPSKTASELLSRVILYKVGHHASHNATAREKGLELMTSPDLVAMIPVVEAVAREQVTKSNKEGWAMPYGDLYARLKTKTSDRLLRGDGDPAVEESAWKAAGGRFSLAYGEGESPLWVEVETGF